MTAQKKSSQRARSSAVAVCRSDGEFLLKDTCPGEAMEILSERVQIARCQARVVFASRLRAYRLFSSVLHAASSAKRQVFAARDYDAAGIELTRCIYAKGSHKAPPALGDASTTV